MAKLSQTALKALAEIHANPVHVLNSGASDTKGITSPTLSSLRKAGLVVPNGASRATVKGRAARRLTLTQAGRDALSQAV